MVVLLGNLIEELAMSSLRVCSSVVENEKMTYFIRRLKLPSLKRITFTDLLKSSEFYTYGQVQYENVCNFLHKLLMCFVLWPQNNDFFNIQLASYGLCYGSTLYVLYF
jgi:hypothetical protein